MTKKVRIENADNSDFKIKVQVWNISNLDEPHTLVSETELNYPTEMRDFMIWKGQYLVVKEQ